MVLLEQRWQFGMFDQFTDLNGAQLREGTIEDSITHLARQPRDVHDPVNVRMLVINRATQGLPCSLISRAHGVGGCPDLNTTRAGQIENTHWFIRSARHAHPTSGDNLTGEHRAIRCLHELIANDRLQKGRLEVGSDI